MMSLITSSITSSFFFDYVIYYVIGKNFVYKKFLKIFFQYRGYPFQLNYEIKII